MPQTDFIICTYDNRQIIENCLNSIKKQSSKNHSTMVVDDNSTDETAEFVNEYFKWVKVIKKKETNGPSISRNIGIQNSKAPYIAFLDSDAVLDKNWLKEQLKLMKKNKKTGILASKLIYYSDRKKLNAAGGTFNKIGIGFDIGKGQEPDKFNEIKQVLYACSAAILVRREMLDKIGAFDEEYHYGHEDGDLGWRANIAGYKVIYNPKAVAYHMTNYTISKMGWEVSYNGTKNRIRSLIKNYSFHNLIIYLPAYALFLIFDIIIRPYRIAKIKAWLWNFFYIFDTLKERRKVQKTRKVKDREIKKLFML